jgi:hypothetical protein
MGVECHLSFLVSWELIQYTVSNSIICGYFFCLQQNTILFTDRFVKFCTVFSSGKGRDFSRLFHLHIGSGAYPAFCTVGMLALSLLVKQQLGHKVKQLPPSVASINVWICLFTVLYIFMTWCLIRHRDKV